MNYYEHHIGDYDQATAHLSAVEDGIYSRLIRWYMASEQPLPNDLTAIQRRVRAHSRDEKAAVKTVLGEFFEHREDGYHQHRCDEEIARYQAKQEKARASANKRWANVQTASEGNANASDQHDAQYMRTHSEGNAPRARPQTPDTRHQSPDPNQGVTTTGDTSTVVGAICVGLRRIGVQVSPHQLQVQELGRQVSANAITVETVIAAGEEARRNKPDERIGIGLVAAILDSWAKKAKAMNVAGARPPQHQPTAKAAAHAAAMNSIGLGGQHDEQPVTFDAATGQREH